MKLNVLAFGVHPDDVELSCAGVLISEKKQGQSTGIVDITRGELGTRGTADTRKQEAADSASILQVDVRDNLGLADGFFQNDAFHQMAVIAAIRKYQPDILLCNATEDRHPDHGRAASLVSEAAFLSGLRKIETTHADDIAQQEWRPKYVLHYIQDRFLQPDFVYDITGAFDQKLEAIKAFKTQFNSTDNKEPQTYISTPDFLESVINRSKMFGKMIGVKYAEGFTSQKMIGIRSFDALIKENT